MPQRRAVALVACCALLPMAAPACTLTLADHRRGPVLARLPLDPTAPALRVAFTHSVLGTPVEDHYVFRHGASGWQAVLVEERWVGEGYGLPIAAGPGETLVRDHSLGSDGWKLTLQRPVHPLVVLVHADGGLAHGRPSGPRLLPTDGVPSRPLALAVGRRLLRGLLDLLPDHGREEPLTAEDWLTMATWMAPVVTPGLRRALAWPSVSALVPLPTRLGALAAC